MPEYNKAFQKAVNLILAHEGGYVNDPDDPGGETKFGISKRAYPNVDIAALTREDAVALYHRDYWQPIHGDDLPPLLAMAVFDAAVNQGVSRAAKLLQKSLRVTADGKIGPQTLAATKNHPPLDLLADYMSRRAKHYHKLACKNPSQAKYIRGWLKRLFITQGHILTQDV
ncbi:glycoside hydrolase family 108 protein [Magnetococcus sp. PR-3]|uniref:glycoside hydrolase family 108 protein n=1 Tax=Magnetococcus sp. PR-3 TaxID=3120355 RepID=UPI002FCE632F